ncbi:MAG TPA: 50S ribosomal protein L7/L12 [Ignavibacteria bacterium]|nr:50S ribosomal protein L7/L12 [Ignavibacteria bacterium]
MSAVEELVDKISNLTLTEAADLKKALEDKFGVTAAAPVMMGGMAPAGGDGGAKQEEQTEFTVMLVDAGAQKINVIKAVKNATGLGLTESKALVEGAPKPVKENISKEEANKLKAELEAAGGKVELK